MPQLLGRKYRLIFGKPGTTGTVITGLDVDFDIEKTTISKPNTASITVFNLSRESRAAIEEKDVEITLEAGYEGQYGIIFTGNDLLVQTQKAGVDSKTIIRSRDGGNQISDTVVNLDVPAGESIEGTVRNILKKYKKLTGREVELGKLPKGKTKRPKVIAKRAAEALDEILGPLDYEWSIQDGEFRVVPVREGSLETVYILGSGSGLIGSPEKTKIRTGAENKETDGVIFTCLLNPQITPLRRVQLAGETVKGMYKVTKVNIRGSTFGGDWYTVAEGVPL